jgi:predicted nucleic acid-binding protein
MAAVASYLADTSALARTRTTAEFDQLRADRDVGYEWLATHDEDWRRALDVQGTLWRRGQVRAVGFPDLLVAAVAERERVTVLHYDADYDLIAHITGQPTQWIVPRGTVP